MKRSLTPRREKQATEKEKDGKGDYLLRLEEFFHKKEGLTEAANLMQT